MTPQLKSEETSVKKNESIESGLFEGDKPLPEFGLPTVVPVLGSVVVAMAKKQRRQAHGVSKKNKAEKNEKLDVLLGVEASNNPGAISNMIRNRNQRSTKGVTQKSATKIN